MVQSLSTSFESSYDRIKEILETARSRVYRAANSEMVISYWNIGRTIFEEEQKGSSRAGYGKLLLESLSIRLTNEFGKGFDKSNLWNMIGFYKTYSILDALRRELSWTNYRLLLKVDQQNLNLLDLVEVEHYFLQALNG